MPGHNDNSGGQLGGNMPGHINTSHAEVDEKQVNAFNQTFELDTSELEAQMEALLDLQAQMSEEERLIAEAEAAAYEQTMQLVDELMAAQNTGDDISLSIEGVGLSTSTSPVTTPASSTATTVSIVSDSSSGDVLETILKGIDGAPPEIICAVKMPNVSLSAIKEVIDLNQVERQLLKEMLTSGMTTIAGLDPDELYTALAEENEIESASLEAKVNALSDLQTKANLASTGLNVTEMSSQIMVAATDKLSEITEASDTCNDPLPASLDDYLLLTMGANAASDSTPGSNTGRIIMLAQDLLNSALSTYPGSLQGANRTANAEASLFSVPPPAGYDHTTVNDPEAIPTNHLLMKKNDYSIISRFVRSHVFYQSDSNPTHANTEIEKRGIAAYSTTDVIDEISNIITVISNELITSAGIGRLAGSTLGDRFLRSETSSSPSTNQAYSIYHPYDKVLGMAPSTVDVKKFFESGPDYAGSLLDYLALGEEAEDEVFVVMPFEANTAKTDSVVFVSGKKYFIDVPLQRGGDSIGRDGLKNFSNNFSGFMTDMKNYLNEMLALDQETNLSPQMIFSRILQDFESTLLELSKPAETRDPTSSAIAGLFARAPYQTFKICAGDTINVVTLQDFLKAATVRAVSNLDTVLEDSSFKLSTAKTEWSSFTSNDTRADEDKYDADGNEIPSDGNFDSVYSKSIAHLSSGLSPGNFAQGTFGGDVTQAGPIDIPQFEDSTYVPSQYEPVATTLGLQSLVGYELHDQSWASSSNLLNLMAKTIRELQSEALLLAQRDGADSVDYRTSLGETYLSGTDDDKFIEIMTNLYIKLANCLLPAGTFAYRESGGEASQNLAWERGGYLGGYSDTLSATNCANLVSKLRDTLTNGGLIDDALITGVGLLSETQLNDVESDVGIVPGYTFEAGDLVALGNLVVKHRYNLKAISKILDSISDCVAASSVELSTILDILDGNVENTDDLTDNELVLYNMFHSHETASGQVDPTNTVVSEQQNNLNRVAYHSIQPHSEDDLFFFRNETFLSKAERLALDAYVGEVYESRTANELDSLHIMSIGMPLGLIEALTRPSFTIGTSADGNTGVITAQAFNHLTTDEAGLSNYLELVMDRYDEAYTHPQYGSILTAGLSGGGSSLIFDPEIFLLPESIQYDPTNTEFPGLNGYAPAATFAGIRNTTMFYRIRGGQVIEEIWGADLGSLDMQIQSACTNALRSYLLDLFLYETVKMRHYDGACYRGSPVLTEAGYNLLNNISSDYSKSSAVVNRTGFIQFFDQNRKLKTEFDLKNLLVSRTEGVPADFGVSDLRTTAALTLMPQFTDNSPLISTRQYERVWNFLYDENIVRSSLTWPETSTRENFDAFSLVVRASLYGGS